jgi:outer membrane lipopolysaccharide assembly protein LptE/RlpB
MGDWSLSSSPDIVRVPRRLALLMVCASLATGCGYALSGHGSYLPSTIKTVVIPPVENRSSVSRLDQLLTERVRVEFINRNRYKLVNDEADADAALRAQIVDVRLQPTGLNSQQLTSRYLVIIVLKVSFVDLKNPDQPLWSNDALTFRDEYDLGTTNLVNPSNIVDQSRSAFDRISTDAARTIVTAIFEAF